MNNNLIIILLILILFLLLIDLLIIRKRNRNIVESFQVFQKPSDLIQNLKTKIELEKTKALLASSKGDTQSADEAKANANGFLEESEKLNDNVFLSNKKITELKTKIENTKTLHEEKKTITDSLNDTIKFLDDLLFL